MREKLHILRLISLMNSHTYFIFTKAKLVSWPFPNNGQDKAILGLLMVLTKQIRALTCYSSKNTSKIGIIFKTQSNGNFFY